MRYQNLLLREIDYQITKLKNEKIRIYRNQQTYKKCPLSDIFIINIYEYIFIISDTIFDYWQVKNSYFEYYNRNKTAQIKILVYFYKFNKFKQIKTSEIFIKKQFYFNEMEDFSFEYFRQSI